MIELQNICFEYGSEEQNIAGRGALHNINLHIPDGQIVLLCGESGCGKTTITRLLNGLIPHFYEGNLTGTICIDGKEINDQPLYETALLSGTVFQNPRSQFFNVDTTSELAFGLENRGMEETQILKKVDKTVQELQLEKLMNRSIFDLSGGEKQRLAMARALYKDGKVVILDEPTAALDALAEDRMYREFENMIYGKTAVFISHRLGSTRFCDKIAMFEDGTIVEEGTHEELMAKNGKYAYMFGIQSQYYDEKQKNSDNVEDADLEINEGVEALKVEMEGGQ
jgi:energy-coupling factor transport system ATP-binding protein